MSVPTLEPDDPRLTAYALGEMDDTERPAIEKMLAASPSARAEVEQTQAVARTLAEEYAKEQTLYLASRQASGAPSNVVAFPTGRARPWFRATGVWLKVAAVAAITASLVYLTLQKSRRPEVMTAASAPPREPAGSTTGQIHKAEAAKAEDKENPDVSNPQLATEPMVTLASPPPGDADVPPVMEEKTSAETSDKLAGGRVPRIAPARDAALPAPESERAAAAPAAASSSAGAARRSAKPASPDKQIARSVVRIRTASGVVFGGVIVSANGLILSAISAPPSDLRKPCTVFLADQREFTSVAEPANLGSGWHWLHVDAKALSAIPLATDYPVPDAPLTTAHVDPQTGVMSFSRLDATSGAGDADFVFNAAGELLVVESPSLRSKTLARADGSTTNRILVRPFSPAERAGVRQAAEEKRNKQ